MSTITEKFVKGVDVFIHYCHKTANVIVCGFDQLNGVPSEKEVTLEEVLDHDKSHRMSLDKLIDSKESLYDVYDHDEKIFYENPGFVDDEVVIEFFPIEKKMEFHEIHNEKLEFSQRNPMIGEYPKMDNNVPKDNTLSAELSFFENLTKVFLAIGMTFEFDSLFSNCYTFSMETVHWKLEVILSRHKQPQWLFIVKNQWFLTYSQIDEISRFPIFELPNVVSNHNEKYKKTNILIDEITEFEKELKSIYNLTIQILEDLQKSRQKLKDALNEADAIFDEYDFSSSQSPEKDEQPSKNVLFPDLRESNVLYIGFWSWMKLYSILFHSQKCGLLWVAREILSQELLAGQLTGFYQFLRGLFRQILSLDLLSGKLCCFKKERGLFRQILSSDLLSGQLCYMKKVRGSGLSRFSFLLIF